MVDVWDSPWIRDDDNFFIDTPRDPELRGLRVCDLFIPGLREWDVELIQTLFSERDANAILGIPLVEGEFDDRRIWHFGNKGVYTVRSCYRLIMDRMVPRDHLDVPGPWRSLWDAVVPPRMRVFMWRIARGILPTRMALQNRHLGVPHECGVCGTSMENSWHLFLACSFARRCWDVAGVGRKIEDSMLAAESMQEWVFKLVENGDTDFVAQAIAIMSAIWRERNNRVWSEKTCEPFAVVRDGLEGCIIGWQRKEATWLQLPHPQHVLSGTLLLLAC
ncbi:Putative ribonuclease H protein At1g65750 [Linum perenne]